MDQTTTRSIRPAFLAFLLVLLAGISPLGAIPCTSGQPICNAAPGDRVCSNDSNRRCIVNADCAIGGTCTGTALGIGGIVTANPNSITSVVLTAATNVTLSVGSTPASTVYFRAVQTNPSLDAQATVLATDSLGATCKVPINFHVRGSGAASNEPICVLAENYQLDVISSPVSPAGTTACSSHLATCADTAASGTDFLAGDSRILAVRSPIAGAGVLMELTRGGAFNSGVRMLFSRSTDSGASYSPFADVTTSVLPGSTRVRGTGQWSDVRVAAAVFLVTTPTLGAWGMILLILLMVTAASVVLVRRGYAPAASGAVAEVVPPAFNPRIYVAAAGGMTTLSIAVLATLSYLGFEPTTADVAGSLASAAILAYWVQLCVAATKGPPRGPQR